MPCSEDEHDTTTEEELVSTDVNDEVKKSLEYYPGHSSSKRTALLLLLQAEQERKAALENELKNKRAARESQRKSLENQLKDIQVRNRMFSMALSCKWDQVDGDSVKTNARVKVAIERAVKEQVKDISDICSYSSAHGKIATLCKKI